MIKNSSDDTFSRSALTTDESGRVVQANAQTDGAVQGAFPAASTAVSSAASSPVKPRASKGSSRRAIIFGAGQYYDEMPFITADSYVIAADGGYDHVVSLGITPHAFIGDKDSLLEDLPEDSATRIIELPSEKDDSDLMAAVRYAWELGVREFEFYGVSGGRVDHSFANIQVAAKIASYGGVAFMHADHTIITVIANSVLKFPSGYVSSKRPISIFAYSSVCEHVSIQGLKYCVDDISMSNIEPLGLSNEFLPDTPAIIAVDGGALIVMYPSEAPTPRITSYVEQSDNFGTISLEKSDFLHNADRSANVSTDTELSSSSVDRIHTVQQGAARRGRHAQHN